MIQPTEMKVGYLQGLSRGAGEDGMAMLEKGVEGSAQAIIVELVGGGGSEDAGARFLSPGAETGQRRKGAQSAARPRTETLASAGFAVRHREDTGRGVR